jgi:hypothetical protein
MFGFWHAGKIYCGLAEYVESSGLVPLARNCFGVWEGGFLVKHRNMLARIDTEAILEVS